MGAAALGLAAAAPALGPMLSSLPWEPLAGAAAAAGAAANQEFAGPEGDAGSDAIEMCEKEALPDCRSVAECLAKELGPDAKIRRINPLDPIKGISPGTGYIPNIIAMPASKTWSEHYVVQLGEQFFDKTHGINYPDGVSEDELLKIFGNQQIKLSPYDVPPGYVPIPYVPK